MVGPPAGGLGELLPVEGVFDLGPGVPALG